MMRENVFALNTIKVEIIMMHAYGIHIMSFRFPSSSPSLKKSV